MSFKSSDRSGFERAIVGALKSAIDAHGPITKENVSSAAKRVVSVAKLWRQDELKGDEIRTLYVPSHHQPGDLARQLYGDAEPI
jgi:hypothetical protein